MSIEVKTTAFLCNWRDKTLSFETRDDIEKQIQFLEDILNNREQRLEFFDDGIYLDGKPLGLRGRHEAILRCFEVLDKVPVIDLIYRVWGNGEVTDSTVRSTISAFNSRFEQYGIFIEKECDFYRIFRNV